MMKADRATFLAFLQVNASPTIMYSPKIMNPRIESTMKTMCGMKFPSVTEVVAWRWLSLGVSAKARIRIPGTRSPAIEQISGLLELRQARHQIMEKMIAIMMMRVPTPTPMTLEEDWQRMPQSISARMMALAETAIQMYIVQLQINLKRMQGSIGDILHQEQIRELIGKLTQIDISDYANTVWYKQDESLQRLNMQLHINALMKNDQYILQECVTQEKFKTIIYDLIMTATWKEKVLPKIRNLGQPPNSLKLYLAIYHESVICNILETFMFYRTAIDESGDFLIEVIDYCYKKISKQVADSMKRRKIQRELQGKRSKMTEQEKREIAVSKILKRTPQEELTNQIEDIEFKIFIMCISIIRYITDYIKHMQIGILHHLLIQCNIFSVLVPLIEERPWLKTTEKGEREVFQDGKWSVVPKSDYGKLPKTEAQVWIAIFNLFMSPECNKKYEINDQRKNTLLRLRKYLNEVLLDQIPNLSYMLRSLEELSIMNVPTHLTSNPFVVQQIPIIASEISKGRNWEELAKVHLERLKQSMDESQRAHMMKLADLYTNNDIEGLTEGFKCAKCKKTAFKRCSKCKGAWYCSKECQVSDWPTHKATCSKRAKELKEAEQSRKKEIIIPKKPTIDELD